MVKIKICGLSRPEDMEAVNLAKPDYCGFIVEFPKSHRSVSREHLRELTAMLRKEIQAVGVFVNAPIELPMQLLNEGSISMAQLHGQEDDRYIDEVRNETGRPVIKAFSVRTREDIEQALRSHADYVLLDQGNGGTGQTFDWSLIQKMEKPFFLAGGLGAENLMQAIAQTKPWAVDLSSSLEINGVKDSTRIQQVVHLVRTMQRQTICQK